MTDDNIILSAAELAVHRFRHEAFCLIRLTEIDQLKALICDLGKFIPDDDEFDRSSFIEWAIGVFEELEREAMPTIIDLGDVQ